MKLNVETTILIAVIILLISVSGNADIIVDMDMEWNRDLSVWLLN